MKEKHKEFLKSVRELKRQGKTEKEISEILGFKTVAELRRTFSLLIGKEFNENIDEVKRLKEEGCTRSEIAKKLNLSESSVLNMIN